MNVKKSQICSLFTAMGFVTCATWDSAKLLKKAQRLPSIVEEDLKLGKEDKKTLTKLLAAIEAEEEIVIEADDAPAASKPAKKKSKPAPAPAAEDSDDDDDSDEDAEDSDDDEDSDEDADDSDDDSDDDDEAPAAAKPAKKKKKETKPAAKPAATNGKKKKGASGGIKSAGGVGVIGSIVEFLKAGSAKKPVSKTELVEKLSARFPDRSPESMKATVNVQLPNRLRVDKELDVQKNDNGYWIAK